MDSFRLSDAKCAHPVKAKYRYPVKKMCSWLGVSSSGFFDWRGRPASATAHRRVDLTDKIVVIFEASDGTYGYRRVHAQLARQGQVCGPELVRSLMGARGLVSCQPRPRVNLTKGDGREHHIPDLLEQDFTAPAPGLTMIGDITYVPTWEGWLYLATVIDVHTRMVIGYAMDDNYRTTLISAALRNATTNQQIGTGAVFHSDRGSNGRFNQSSQHRLFVVTVVARRVIRRGSSSRGLSWVDC